MDTDRAEAVFISCTGFRSVENLERPERKLVKPVISANQATFADCLRILGVDQVAPGYGSLSGKVLATQAAA